MHRAEAALLHEDWQGDWRARWALGPSAPPAGRPAYRVLEVCEAKRAERLAQSAAVDERGGDEERESESSESEEEDTAAEPRRYLRGDCVRIIDTGELDNRQGVLVEWLTLRRRWRVELLGAHAAANAASADEPAVPATVLVRERNLRPAEGTCATGAAPPTRWLALSGGWHMNYSGVHRAFGAPLKPRRISFRINVAETCGARSFFNVYLGSGEEPCAAAPAPLRCCEALRALHAGGHARCLPPSLPPSPHTPLSISPFACWHGHGRYKDRAVFWAGSHAHPPEPADVFTLLFDTSGSGQRPAAQMWLPSGRACPVAASVQRRVWHQVRHPFACPCVPSIAGPAHDASFCDGNSLAPLRAARVACGVCGASGGDPPRLGGDDAPTGVRRPVRRILSLFPLLAFPACRVRA